MNIDEREERIAIVAEGCKVSQEDAEKMVDRMRRVDTVQCSIPVPPRCHRQDI